MLTVLYQSFYHQNKTLWDVLTHISLNQDTWGIWGHLHTIQELMLRVANASRLPTLEGLGTESICASVFFELGHEFMQHIFLSRINHIQSVLETRQQPEGMMNSLFLMGANKNGSSAPASSVCSST